MEEYNKKCEVKNNELLGRYLVASKDIKPGELLLHEKPSVVGPYWDAEISCLTCYRASNTMCRLCNKAPLCLDCLVHQKDECEFLQNDRIPQNFLLDHFNAVMPMRMMYLYKSDRPLFDEIMKMESHLEHRRGSNIWGIHDKYVVQPLLENEIFRSTKDFTFDEDFIQKLCGILDVNTFELRGNIDSRGFQPNNLARGLFPKAALLAHDCMPNTLISVDGDLNLRIFSTVPIPQGECVYYNYTRSLFNTFERRTHLREGKYFKCICQRCCDPTELGTFMSSIKCKICSDGFYSFHEDKVEWKCNVCDDILKMNEANDILVGAKNEILQTPTEYRQMERIVGKYSKILGPTHSFVLDMKQNLAGELRAMTLHMDVDEIPKNILKRKVEICDEMLKILGIVDPGISRLKGIALYECHAALVQLAQRSFHHNEINAIELLKYLQKGQQLLKEAINMLLFEHISTPEGQLTRRAMIELKQLRQQAEEVQILVDEEIAGITTRKNLKIKKKNHKK